MVRNIGRFGVFSISLYHLGSVNFLNYRKRWLVGFITRGHITKGIFRKMKYLFAIFAFCLAFPAVAAEICELVTHPKLSLADFADGPGDTENFYFSDKSELIRNGTLTIIGRHFEVETDGYSMTYECKGRRYEPCVGTNVDERFISEARIDMTIGVVLQLERQISGGFNPFSRGGVADGGLALWKILACR